MHITDADGAIRFEERERDKKGIEIYDRYVMRVV